MTTNAGRFDFEDGGSYCGGWEDGKAHGHGVCTGPKSMGEFSGLWQFGYEVSGVYIWPKGDCYQGQWMSGKRHGLGVEKKQRWIYKGEWAQGFKGRYGMRISEHSGAKYEGTWANGLQDGYGSEAYADGGTYFGQMSQGMRNGYGIRKSVSYGVASRYRSKDVKDSLTSLRSEDGDEKVQRERDRRFDENRGGFVLRAKSDLTEEVAAGVSMPSSGAYMPNSGGNIMTNAINGLLRRRRNSFGQGGQDRRVSLRKTIMSKLKKQKSVGDIDDVNPLSHRGAGGTGSHANLNTIATSVVGRNKKSSFRSTSSNNSVDSRTSNRTAPAGLGLNSPSMAGMHNNTHLLNNNMNNNNNQQDDGEHSFISQDEITDVNCIEVYMGEWKQDKRTGYGIAERSDGLKYEGEWFNNKKNGYGVTTFKDGTKEEGKYKNNVLATDKKKAKLLLLRSNKIRQKIDAAVNAALKAGQIAQQRADIALARAVNARTKAHAAELAAKQARGDSDYARVRAHEVAPDFVQPGEIKKMPDIPLDIDKMNGFGGQFSPQMPPTGLGDPVAFNNISPSQFRKSGQLDQFVRNSGGGGPGPGVSLQDPYLNWQQQQQQSPQQQSNSYTPHSATPPPQSSMLNNLHSRISTNNINSQFYDPNLIIPAQQLLQQQQQQQQQQKQFHPSIDTTGKLNNDCKWKFFFYTCILILLFLF
jgi:junctophilin